MSEKRFTAIDVVKLLSEKSGLTIEQVKSLLQAQAELAYTHAAQGYLIPGLGTLKRLNMPERRMIRPFGPKQGEEIFFPAKIKLKFFFSYLARTMMLHRPKQIPNIFDPVQLPGFTFSTNASELSDPSMFVEDLGEPFTLVRDSTNASISIYRLHDLHLPSGRIVAEDILIGGGKPFCRSVAPGSYPLALAIVRFGKDERVALAIIRFSNKRVVKWEIAIQEGQESSIQKTEQISGYSVDSATGCFCDASVQQLVNETNESDVEFYSLVNEEMRSAYKNTRGWIHIETPNGSLAVFSSGYGDGFYTSYFGLDEMENPVVLVTDFKLVKWGPIANR